MIVKPFRGLRPREDLASRIPSCPYDVVDSDEARRLAEGDPHTFLHVVKPEIDLEPGIDPHDDRVYRRARENFQGMLDEGWLERDPVSAFYVYRLETEDHSQTGIVGAASVEDYLGGRIRRHELTREAKERDRAIHMRAVGANTGIVATMHRPAPELSALVQGVTSGAPSADFEAPDGVRHALWVVDGPADRDRIESLFSKVPHAYITDGHHRAAAAARVAREDREGTGSGAAEWFLAAFFPSNRLRVLDYNRLVRDLNGLDAESFVERLRASGLHVTPGHRAKRPPHRHAFGTYLPGAWHLVTVPAERVPDDVCDRLDVAVLSDLVLEPILGIGDVRTDPRIEFVGGVRGTEELERRVDSGEFAVAFAMYPTSVDDVMEVADAGRIMPPKSTWFEPKLRSGMVVRLLEDEAGGR